MSDVYVFFFFFFSSRRRHTRYIGDWSSDVCSSDLDEMSHAVLLDEAADLRHALLGAADDEAILHELVEIRRDRRVDERMRSEERRVGKECRCRWESDA